MVESVHHFKSWIRIWTRF